MSHSQFRRTILILTHAWLNLLDKHMTTGRINQITTFARQTLQTHKFTTNSNTLLTLCGSLKPRPSMNQAIWFTTCISWRPSPDRAIATEQLRISGRRPPQSRTRHSQTFTTETARSLQCIHCIRYLKVHIQHFSCLEDSLEATIKG